MPKLLGGPPVHQHAGQRKPLIPQRLARQQELRLLCPDRQQQINARISSYLMGDR
jgi:hypothetical protein